MPPPLEEKGVDAVQIEGTWYLCCHLLKFQFYSLTRSGIQWKTEKMGKVTSLGMGVGGLISKWGRDV